MPDLCALAEPKKKMKRVLSRELLKEIAKRKDDTDGGPKSNSGGGSGSGAEDSMDGSEDVTTANDPATEVDGSEDDDGTRSARDLESSTDSPRHSPSSVGIGTGPKVIQRKGSSNAVTGQNQTDKQRIAQRIVGFFSEKMPTFSKGKENLENLKFTQTLFSELHCCLLFRLGGT